MPEIRGEHFLESLERGMRMLASFDSDHPTQTLSEAARRTDLGRATARRILLTLRDLGYVQLDGRDFSLTSRVLDFGFSYLSSKDLVGVAERHIRALSQEINETVALAILDGHDIRYVARANAPRAMHLNVPVGQRMPAHVTSAGRLLVANLPEAERAAYLATADIRAYTTSTTTDREELAEKFAVTRARGWSESSSELDLGMQGYAVPVPTDSLPAALSAVFPLNRFPQEELPEVVVRPLQECARAIAEELRGR